MLRLSPAQALRPLPLVLAGLFVAGWSLDVGGLLPPALRGAREGLLALLLLLWTLDFLLLIRRRGLGAALERRRGAAVVLALAWLGLALLALVPRPAPAADAGSSGIATWLSVCFWVLSLLQLGQLNLFVGGPRLAAPVFVLAGFAGVILAGALMLVMPAAAGGGQRVSFLDALFTATSGTCVTGLTVFDIGTRLSFFGQGILLLLIQVGGVGILTVTSLFALLMRRDLRTRETLAVSAELGTGRLRGLGGLIVGIVGLTLAAELLGALALLAAGVPPAAHGGRFFTALFHAVSAFCNAGFGLAADNLAGWLDIPAAVVIVALLIMLGGLGYLVILELLTRLRGRSRRRLSMQARLVLVGSLLLWAGGFLLFLWTERDATQAGASPGRRCLMAFFQSVTPRTAGFEVAPQSALAPPSFFATMLLMFVGGGAGSTAGGIKVSTMALAVLLVAAHFRGRDTVELAGRRVPAETLRQALAVVSACLLLVFGATLALLILEGGSPDRAAFEVVSAFGTVGLSTGLSAELGAAGKLLLILVMYLGRVGPLTVAVAVAGGLRPRAYALPEERVMVG